MPPESYGGLALGPHTFQVRAADALGNVDPTPASYTWTVVPANDAFAAATVLSGADGQATGTTLYATKEPDEPAHAGSPGGHSVWYRWTAPCRCTITFKTLGSSFDTVLAAYTGASVTALKLVASNDDSPLGTTTSLVRFKAPAGTTYWIAVDGKDGASGPIVLSWRHI
jgi:hypothetical protein